MASKIKKGVADMKRVVLTVAAVAMLGGCAEMADLDRGLYGAVNTVGARDTVTGARTLSTSGREQMVASQNAEMDKAFADFTAKGGKLNADVDAAGYARVQKVVGRLLQVSHFAGENGKWKVFLLPDKEFNAFVNGGSYVMVNKGLLDAVKSDDELAAVIGHEIGHNAANHIGERSTYQQVALISGSKSATRGTFQQSFTMTQENEADRIGILYAALAGYDPFAASRVWERMYASEGNQVLVSDHPLNRARIDSTRAVAEKVKVYYRAGVVNPEAQQILVSNTLWNRQGDVVEAGKGGGVAALAETALNTYLAREQTKQVEKSQQAHAVQVAQVRQALQVVDVQVVDADHVQVDVVYGGNVPLKVLALVAQAGGVRAVAHVTPPVVPGQKFRAVFEGKGIGTSGKVALGVDDADF